MVSDTSVHKDVISNYKFDFSFFYFLMLGMVTLLDKTKVESVQFGQNVQ